MKVQITKSILILLIFISKAYNSNAQTWAVGTPVNQTILVNAFGYGALGGCTPSPDVTWNFIAPTVTGVQFSLIVSATDPNSAYIMPGNDTLAINDTIQLVGGNNFISLYYFASNPNPTPIQFNLYAKGTPQTSGQAYPCNLNFINLISNLLICPETLSGTIPTNCTVIGNPTYLNEDDYSQLTINYPNSGNNYKLTTNVPINEMSIYTLNGQRIISNTNSNSIDCNNLSNGIYVVKMIYKNSVQSYKLNISK